MACNCKISEDFVLQAFPDKATVLEQIDKFIEYYGRHNRDIIPDLEKGKAQLLLGEWERASGTLYNCLKTMSLAIRIHWGQNANHH